jgi:hypothetical protein
MCTIWLSPEKIVLHFLLFKKNIYMFEINISHPKNKNS